MLTNMNFYDICHEHLSYYSLDALRKLMARNGLRRVRCLHQRRQRRQPARLRDPRRQRPRLQRGGTGNLEALAKVETALELDQAQTYRDYFRKIEDLAHRVNAYLDADIARRQGVRAGRLDQGQRAAAVLRHHQGENALYQRAQSRTRSACARWAPISS